MPAVPVTMASETLHDLPESTPAKGELAQLDARLEAASEQQGRGLRATLALANASAAEIDLLNPVDLLRWQLLDATGAALDLPQRVPNLRVRRPADSAWKLDSAVPVIAVRRDGREVDPAVLDTPRLSLKVGAELAVTFEFDRTVRDGQSVELPSGDYRLVCLATLIDAADTQRTRIVRCDPLPVILHRS